MHSKMEFFVHLRCDIGRPISRNPRSGGVRTVIRELIASSAGIQLFITLVVLTVPLNAETAIEFDVPALAAGIGIESDEGVGLGHLIEVHLPVSLNLVGGDRIEVDQMEIEIAWIRRRWQVTHFSPQTTLHSEIVGTVKVEQRQDQTNGLGVKLSSGYFDMVSGGGNAQHSRSKGETVRFEKTPPQRILVSAGTIQRGTGVRFRLHPSSTTTLEGSHELVVGFSVPADWRAGLLKVTCRVEGKRKILGTFSESIEHGEAFTVPVYRAGDAECYREAMEMVEAEEALRAAWNRYQKQLGAAESGWFGATSRGPAELPESWVWLLIQSGSDRWLENYARRLPAPVHATARQYVAARNRLLADPQR